MMEKEMTVCALYGVRDLRVERRPVPAPGAGEVLVRIRAAGICGSDVERVFTKGTYRYPTVIGHEFSGEVADHGAEDASWQGKRVSVFPLLPCMRCPACLSGRYAQCGHYDYYGSRRDGGFAEYLAVRTWNLLPIPDEVSYESAAMFEPAAVGIHALRQAGALLGKTLAVFGVGAVALMLAQSARASGCARVLLVVRSRAKAEFARGLGFRCVFNSAEEDAVSAVLDLTDGQGADVTVEGCGRPGTLDAAVRCAAPFGTVICLGNPAETMSLDRDVYWQILRKQLRLCGTWNSSFKAGDDDWRTAMDLAASGRLRLRELITGRYALDQAAEAFDALHRRDGALRVKSMFVAGDERG